MKGKTSAPGMLLKGACGQGRAGEELSTPPGTSIGWQRVMLADFIPEMPLELQEVPSSEQTGLALLC